MNLEEIKQVIPDKIEDRLPKEMVAKFKDSKPLVDIHTHIFTVNDVPSKFLGIRLPLDRRFTGRIIGIMNAFNKKKHRSDRIGPDYLIQTMRQPSSDAIYKLLNGYYIDKSPDTVFGVLTMDMGIGIEGDPVHSIEDQFSEVAMVRNKYPSKIIPFACIDPRREDALELFKKAFDSEGSYRYFGLKVYPSLGYLPSHPTLMKMLEICEEKQIPVLTHCSSGSTHGTDKRSIAQGTFVHYNKGADGEHVTETNREFRARRFRMKNDYRNFYNRPHHWDPVLKRFNRLKLNIAHFGGDQAWEEYLEGKDKWVDKIIEQINTYDNVYSDFSYTMYKSAYNKELKKLILSNEKLKTRVLYGSDYYMLVLEEDFGRIINRFQGDMGHDLMMQLAKVNPRNYLGL